MKKNYILLLIFVLCTTVSYSQDIFKKVNLNTRLSKITENPKNFTQYSFNKNQFVAILANIESRETQKTSKVIISLPNDKGDFVKFEVFEASVFSKELSSKYPTIKSYVGRSIDGVSKVRLSYAPSQGLHAAISNNKTATIIIKPSNIKNGSYISFLRSEMDFQSDFECETLAEVKKKSRAHAKQANDGYLRKYRLAVATTAEFSNFFLDGSEVNDAEKTTKVLAAINTSLTRINGIFERDFSITMQLVANNDATIYFDAATDPFSTNFNQELQNTLDIEIGDGNYDVGHLFGYENSIYGNAGCIACVCTTGSKGSAFTMHSAPDSDNFNMIASHEFGHQFGGYHVQSSSNCRSSAGLQEVEPGSGSSIMGYAGICTPSVQENPDDYFNYVDIRDVLQWTRNDSSCAEQILSGNTDPQVNAGDNYTIPRSTAFILEGTGSDANADDILSFCWEQNDPEDPNSSNLPSSTWVLGPLYRSKLPVSVPIRYMPQLSDVLAGNLTPNWEVTPSVSRTMDFVLTVRDNALLGAKTASSEMTVTVDDSFEPFTVTSQNTTETWNVGDNKTITWNVSNTNQAPINATTVDVFLSIDGGYTYPYTLATNSTNDGSETIIVPEVASGTTQGRFMIKAANNIFYAVNATDINIQTSEFVLSFNENSLNICQPDNAVYSFTYKTFLGFNETTAFSAENLPLGTNVSFNPSTASINNTEVEITISGTESIPLGNNEFVIKGTSATAVKQAVVNLLVNSATLDAPILANPSNNQTNIATSLNLNWSADINAQSYFVEVAADALFTNNINASNINENNYSLNNLEFDTTYYWRVKSINSCNESSFSDTFNFATICSTPSAIITSNPSLNGVDISWTENGNSSNWEIEIVPQGTPPSGVGISTNTNFYSTTSLNSSSVYDIYLKSNCSSESASTWIGPVSFSTLFDFCNDGVFYDTGGLNSNYKINEDIITTIIPEDADVVEVNFINFQIEAGWDFMYVYNGNDINAPLIGQYTGNNGPGLIRSLQGQGLTFRFISDEIISDLGWEATVSCITITCPVPANLNATNIEANSVDLSWTSNGSEANWEVEYGESGFTQGDGTIVSATVNPFTLNGLTPVTNYDIYLRANCGVNSGDDDSNWVGPISVETPCGEFTAPYFYDVEQQNTGTVEDCWTSNPGNNGSYFWLPLQSYQYDTETGPYQAKSGNLFFASYPYNNAFVGDVTELYSPVINIASLNVPVLDFYTFMHGTNVGSLHVDILNNGVWTDDVLVITGEQQTTARDLWQEQLVNLSNFEEKIQIRFRAIAGGNGLNEIDIDDIGVIEMPSCPSPTNFEISTITDKSAVLSWTSNGSETNWEVEYGETGFTQGNGTLVSATVNPFTLNGLTPVTNYDIYLRANCGVNSGDDASNWVGPISIETPCGEFTAPYFYDVEQQNTGTVEDCWTSNPGNNGSYFWLPLQSYQYDTETGPYQAKSGSLFFASYPYNNAFVGDVTELYSPVINIASLNVPVLDFYTFMHGTNVGSLHVDILNNGVWTDDVLVITGEQQTTARDLWQEQLVNLSNFEEKIQIRFRAIAGGNGLNEIDIDDIGVIEMPSCPNPTNFEISTITDKSAVLSWTSNGSETNWEVEYGEVGFTQGNGAIVSATTNPFVLSNLNAQTNYDIYLRANCGITPGNDASNWVGPISIETPCGEFTAPYFYDVEQQNTGTVEDCWTSNPPANNGSYFWLPLQSYQYDTETGPYQAKSGNLFFASYPYNNASSGDVTELYSPVINIASLNVPVLDFYTFMYGTNVGSLHVDIFNNGVWTDDVLVITGEQQTTARDLWQEQLVNLSNFEEKIQIRFRAIAGGNGLNEIDIDDIGVIEMPSCPNPTNFEISTITYESAVLSWISNGSETNWEVEYGEVGFTQGNGAIVSATTNPFVLSNLNAQTNYDIYLRANCGITPGNDASNWVGPISIETPCGEFTAPYFYDVEQQNTGTVEDCWTGNPGNNGSYFWTPLYSPLYDTETGPYQAKSGNFFFASYPYNGSSLGDVTELYSPVINIASLNVPVLDFYTFMHGTNVGSLHIDILNKGVWTDDVLVITGEQQTTARDLWQEQLVSLSDFEEKIQIRFRAIAGGNGLNEIDIDDIGVIEMPSCPNPTNLEISTITDTSIDLNWLSNGVETTWELEYGEAGFIQGNGIKTLVTSNSFTLDNLGTQTSYEIYLRAICGASPGDDDSNWVGPVAVETLANFCNGDHFYDSGGPNQNHRDNENEITVISPISSDYVTVNFLDFDLESCCDRLSIYDGPDVNSPVLGTFTGSSLPGTFTSTHPTGALTFYFTSDGSVTRRGWDAEITCFSESCSVPTNTTVSSIEADQVTVNWEAGSTENSWEIEYGFSNFTQGNGTTIQAPNNTHVLSDLTPGSVYSYYLRAICGNSPGDDDSQWIGPFSFTTSCDALAAPFYENFSAFSTPNCWSEVGGEPWNFNLNGEYAAASAGDGSPIGTTNYAWIDGSYPNGENQISKLRTPWVDISNLSVPALQFSLFSVNYESGTYNTFKVFVNDDIGSRIELYSVQESTDGWKVYEAELGDLNLSSKIQIEFLIHENSPSNSYLNDILIDEVQINEQSILNTDSNSLANFKYYPNPVKDKLTIQSDRKITLILIYNTLGQEVYRERQDGDSLETEVDFSALSIGNYLVKVFSQDKVQTIRIVKETNQKN